MSEQATFPVGARVRWKGRSASAGTVESSFGSSGVVGVRWQGGAIGPCRTEHLERIDTPEPPRAPARTLAPGVESRPDVQGGKPCLAGTRTPTDVVRGWRGWEAFRSAHPHVTPEQYDRALLFEAGVAWERERRRRRKERRAVRRYRKVKELAEVKEGNRG